MRFYQIICALIFSLACSAAVQAKALTVMISGGFMAAWETLAPQFEAQQGYKIHTISGPSMGNTPQAIPARLARGEKADVVIMVGAALQDLEQRGWIKPGSRVELADSVIGAVIKKGATTISIKNEDELRTALLDAPSIAYSDSASGRYISSQLFSKLGIEHQVNSKAYKVERIPVASLVATGQYAIGFQQVSELLPVKGVTFIGELPDNMQYVTRFAGAIVNQSTHGDASRQLLAYLASPGVQQVVQATGLHSVANQHVNKESDIAQ